MCSINVVNLTKVYRGDVTALKSVSFSIERNSMVGFLGPNGAGKTTAIKILTGLIRPTSGSAYLNGVDIQENPKRALRKVGAVVEIPEFYPYLTPIQILGLLGRLRGMERRDIAERSGVLLRLFGLAENANDKVGRFSKGMKQRLALAQAVLHSPDILILDEPTDGLDPEGIAEMRDILVDLKKNGTTILMSSHHLSEVQNTCDRILMLESGSIIADKGVDEAAGETKSKCYDVTMAGEPPPNFMEDIGAIHGVQAVQRVSERKVLIEIDPSSAGSADWLLAQIMSRGLRVESFQPHVIPLEAFYVQRRREVG